MVAIADDIVRSFRKKVCESIEVESEGLDRFIVYTPFHFDDGDGFVVLLQKADRGWTLTDQGHTLMHLDFLGIDLSKGTRSRIAEEILTQHGVNNVRGELSLPIPGDSFGDALFSFLQALSALSTISKMTVERVRSTFIEDFRELLSDVVPREIAAFDWHDPEFDNDENYPVDCRIQVNGNKPCFVFGVNNTDKCRNAVITCYALENAGRKFDSIAIFEDQKAISRQALAQLTDVIGKQFSSLSDRSRIEQYFKEHVIADHG